MENNNANENRILELERKIHALEIDIQHANFNGELATQSPSINKISEALPLAQAEFGEIIPDKIGQSGKDYAGLYPYINATRTALNKYGLYFYHYTSFWKGDTILHARILHKTSEQWIESHVKTAVHRKVNDWSSDETKLKRYTARDLLGVIEPNEDEGDPQEATGKPQTSTKKPTLLPEQVKMLERAINGNERILDEIKSTMRVASLEGVKQTDYNSVMSFVSKELTKELANNE